MTQTTAERMQALIDEMLGYSPSRPGVYNGVAETIAAEIDALTAQRDEATAKAKALTLERDEARAELAKCRGNEEFWKAWNDDDKLRASNNEALRIAAQRDEARAEVERWRAHDVLQEKAVAAQLAEVERLRPAAEAWEAQEKLRPLFHAPIPTDAAEEDRQRRAIEAADRVYQAAAARARAAKGSQP